MLYSERRRIVEAFDNWRKSTCALNCAEGLLVFLDQRGLLKSERLDVSHMGQSQGLSYTEEQRALALGIGTARLDALVCTRCGRAAGTSADCAECAGNRMAGDMEQRVLGRHEDIRAARAACGQAIPDSLIAKPGLVSVSIDSIGATMVHDDSEADTVLDPRDQLKDAPIDPPCVRCHQPASTLRPVRWQASVVQMCLSCREETNAPRADDHLG